MSHGSADHLPPSAAVVLPPCAPAPPCASAAQFAWPAGAFLCARAPHVAFAERDAFPPLDPAPGTSFESTGDAGGLSPQPTVVAVPAASVARTPAIVARERLGRTR